jgi:flagellar biosynthetic protein FlhB
MADEKNDGQERSEAATPRKIEQLRTDGQVARSQDFGATAVLLAVTTALLAFGPSAIESLARVMSKAFRTNPLDDPEILVHALRAAVDDLAIILAPVLAVALVAAIVAPMVIGGWVFSGKPMAFNLDKLDPIQGMVKRVFTIRGLVEMLKAAAKFGIVGYVAVLLIQWELPKNLLLASMDSLDGLAAATWTIGLSFVVLAAAMIIIAMVDVPFQKWNFARQHRMSFDEIKRESRTEDGAPELRAKVRSMQREIAQRRMMEAVPDADVVIVNPTHFAVALKYESHLRHAAPRVVALGADLVAWQIRQRAQAHDVPVVSAPMLARALFHTTELDQEIPYGLYAAVAIVLKYAFRLRGLRGYSDASLPAELPIPENLRFD